MHNCTSHFGEDGVDRFGKALKPIDGCNQNILDATVVQIGQHLQPEVRAFIFGEVKAQYLFLSIESDTQDRIDGFGNIPPILLDLVVDRIEPDKRLDGLQGTLPPLFEQGNDLVRYAPIEMVEKLYRRSRGRSPIVGLWENLTSGLQS